MKEDYIKDFSGRIIGIVETLQNGDQQVRDFESRQILGFYKASSNQTTDFYGRIIANGNTVVSLLYTKN